MSAIAVSTHSVLRFTNFSSFAKPQIKDVNISLGADKKRIGLFVSCIGSDENRRGRSSQRSSKKENDSDNDDKKPNSASQEEIIAIFRRIQSSISNDKPVGKDTTDREGLNKKSILNVLRRSVNNQGKAKSEEGNKTLTRKRVVPKEQRVQDYPPILDSKLTRPFSKFVKRSPIPNPPTPRPISLEPIDGSSKTDQVQLRKLEEMKLVELKELAKSRGIKGYSKLKKSELVNLLRF